VTLVAADRHCWGLRREGYVVYHRLRVPMFLPLIQVRTWRKTVDGESCSVFTGTQRRLVPRTSVANRSSLQSARSILDTGSRSRCICYFAGPLCSSDVWITASQRYWSAFLLELSSRFSDPSIRFELAISFTDPPCWLVVSFVHFTFLFAILRHP
jgi:hypothetical protein